MEPITRSGQNTMTCSCNKNKGLIKYKGKYYCPECATQIIKDQTDEALGRKENSNNDR